MSDMFSSAILMSQADGCSMRRVMPTLTRQIRMTKSANVEYRTNFVTHHKSQCCSRSILNGMNPPLSAMLYLNLSWDYFHQRVLRCDFLRSDVILYRFDYIR